MRVSCGRAGGGAVGITGSGWGWRTAWGCIPDGACPHGGKAGEDELNEKGWGVKSPPGALHKKLRGRIVLKIEGEVYRAPADYEAGRV
jgi:hypothetical protein